jgi:glycosyltransferase involved in cell wall biosynthesis
VGTLNRLLQHRTGPNQNQPIGPEMSLPAHQYAGLASVVIPCFNARAYIESTLRSVLAQGRRVHEVIVVDDGSNDGSPALVRSKFPDVRVIEQRNQGVAVARNTGIEAASAEWIAFVDADDIWLPGKLDQQFALAEAQIDAQVIYGAWEVWTSDQQAPAEPWLAAVLAAAPDERRWGGPTGWIYPQLLLSCEVWTSTVMIKASLLRQIGGFDPKLRIGEDYDLWLRASRESRILRVPRPLALYRQHQQNITRSVPAENFRALVVERALARWGFTDQQGNRMPARRVHQELGRVWAEYADANLGARRLNVALLAVLRGIRLDPLLMKSWEILLRCLGRLFLSAAFGGHHAA